MSVLLVVAYLCLVNLDYAALWHDEAPAAFFWQDPTATREYHGWDGRNLVGGTNGKTLNEDLRDPLPPLMYILNAMGFAIFGVNEIGPASSTLSLASSRSASSTCCCASTCRSTRD